MLKRIVSSLLCVLLVSGAFASCADDTAKTPPETQGQAETTAAETETETEIKYLDMLDKVDYGGEDFNILCRSDKIYEVWVESENSDVVNDAVYRRNKTVEEKYNIVINKRDYDGDWNTQETYKTALKNDVNGDDGNFDLASGYLAYLVTLGMEGYFYDLMQIDTIDPSNPWWAQGYVENNTVLDKLYFALGDFSLTMWEGIYAIYFNKQLAEDHGVGNLYSMVKDKSWTLDKFETLCKGVSDDIDGNSKYTADDLYGLVINRHSMRSLITSCDIPIAVRNDEDTYDFVYYNDKTIALYENIFNFLYDGNDAFITKPANDWDYTEMTKMFLEDRALFITGTLDNTTILRQMDTDFGILPFPLYDANQENYKSHSYDGSNIFAILTSVKDPAKSGMILEALGAESKQSVIPAFYETSLKGKAARDNESEEMLDILRDSLYFDFGFIHAVSIKGSQHGIFQFFGDQMVDKVQNIASSWQKQEKAFNKSFERVIEAYTKEN